MTAALLLATSGVTLSVAGLYHTTQRADVRAALDEPIPYTDERVRDLRGRVRGRQGWVAAYLVVDLVLAVVLVAGAVADDDDTVAASVVVALAVALVALGNAWIMASDLRALRRRAAELPR